MVLVSIGLSLFDVKADFIGAALLESGEDAAGDIDPAVELVADSIIIRIDLQFAEQSGTGEVPCPDVEHEGDKGVELVLVESKVVLIDGGLSCGDILREQLPGFLFCYGHPFGDAGCMTIADGEDSCGAAVGPEPETFVFLDEFVCVVGCFHFGDA